MNRKLFFSLAVAPLVTVLSLAAAEERFVQAPIFSGQSSVYSERVEIIANLRDAAKIFGAVDVTELKDVPLDFALNQVELSNELLNCEVALLNQLTSPHVKIAKNFFSNSLRDAQNSAYYRNLTEICQDLFAVHQQGAFDTNEAKFLIDSLITPEVMQQQNRSRKDFVNILVQLLEKQGLSKQACDLQELLKKVEAFEALNKDDEKKLTVELAVSALIKSFENQTHVLNDIYAGESVRVKERDMQPQGIEKINAHLLAYALDRARLLEQGPTGRQHQPAGYSSTADNVSGCPQQ